MKYANPLLLCLPIGGTAQLSGGTKEEEAARIAEEIYRSACSILASELDRASRIERLRENGEKVRTGLGWRPLSVGPSSRCE